jgi:hypothetical protein
MTYVLLNILVVVFGITIVRKRHGLFLCLLGG